MQFMNAMLPNPRKNRLLLVLTVAMTCAQPALVRAETTTIKLSGGQLVLGEEQKLMLEASGKVLDKDYAAALERYNRVIALNPNNGQAYIQRSVVKRQMGDAQARGSETAAIPEHAFALLRTRHGLSPAEGFHESEAGH